MTTASETVTRAPEGPDWYGRLDCAGTTPTTRPTPASGLWLILHEDFLDAERRRADRTLFEEILAFREHVTRQFPDAVTFEFLPLMFVRGSRDDIAALEKLPRFRFAIPQSVAVEDYLPILRGVNALRSETGHQLYEWQQFVESGGTLPDEKFVGGIWPAGRYPPPLNARLRSLGSTPPRSAPPAWMPLINFSIGPRIPDTPGNPVGFALASTARTHLVVVAAGNDGAVAGCSSVNAWAPPGVLVVGATADEAGQHLARYSSRGLPGAEGQHPDVVAFGLSSLGGSPGTSFAAPRVTSIGCLAAAALFQFTRVLDDSHGATVGVPLVGWGMVDTTQLLALPSRDGTPALPLGGVVEDALIDAFRAIEQAGGKVHFYLDGTQLRSMIVRSARPMPGHGRHEVGAGFVSESGFIDWLSAQTVGELLRPFVEPAGVLDTISETIRSARVFDHAGVRELAEAVRRSRPVWMFDYRSGTFGVNRTPSEGELRLPTTGRSLGHAVQVAASAGG
jgi:hypothetical protein